MGGVGIGLLLFVPGKYVCLVCECVFFSTSSSGLCRGLSNLQLPEATRGQRTCGIHTSAWESHIVAQGPTYHAWISRDRGVACLGVYGGNLDSPHMHEQTIPAASH